MTAALAARLTALLGRSVADLTPLGGGDIGAAFRAELDDGRRVFAKTHPNAALLAREAEGLGWLTESQTLPVPAVVAIDDGNPPVLVLEWIEPGPPTPRTETALGRGLAALHASAAPAFGWARDNYVGSLPQANDARDTWARFYAELRLQPLARRARDAGRIDADVARRLDRVCEGMERFAGPPEPPARLHGDLWGGNRVVDARGASWLIDPAVYGGHREIDLAMMRLFGGFGDACFDAYAESFPLAPGHAERVGLYQLYPLLVHVNLFGGSYAASLGRALSRYLGSP